MIGRIAINTGAAKWLGALLSALVFHQAYAAIQVGGGSTVPALGYVGDATHRINYSPDPGSLFGFYSAMTGTPVSYCQTRLGKNILTGASGTSVQYACPDTSPTGFGATEPQVNRPSLTQPNFAASESPLSASEYSNYVANRGASRPVQFPAIAAGIAIVYNNENLTNTTERLSLSTAQVCGLFNGSLTKWSQLGVVPAPSGDAIKLVYQADNNGANFALSNFLSASCSGTPAQHFKTDQSFAAAVSLFGLPASSWIRVDGDQELAKLLIYGSGEGYIGYASVANAEALFDEHAQVNGHDPVADLGDPGTHKVIIRSTDVVYNNAITGVDANTGRPTFNAIAGAPGTNCIALVKPDAYATQPTDRYPIIAISYLLGNSQGNGADTADVRALLGAPYTAELVNASPMIGPGWGLAFLSAPFTTSQINGCVVN